MVIRKKKAIFFRNAFFVWFPSKHLHLAKTLQTFLKEEALLLTYFDSGSPFTVIKKKWSHKGVTCKLWNSCYFCLQHVMVIFLKKNDFSICYLRPLESFERPAKVNKTLPIQNKKWLHTKMECFCCFSMKYSANDRLNATWHAWWNSARHLLYFSMQGWQYDEALMIWRSVATVAHRWWRYRVDDLI